MQNSLLMVGVLVALLVAAVTTAAPQAPPPPRCLNQKCGNLSVPYPFGMHPDCYREAKFFINCSQSTNPPIAYLRGGSLPVTNISLEEGELQIQMLITRNCDHERGLQLNNIGESWIRSSDFTISGTKNKFMAVGCDTDALFGGYRGGERYMSGCTSFCQSFRSISESCSGIGCCQTSIPSGLKNQNITLRSYYNHRYSGNPCSYAFVVEDGKFNFSGEKSFRELNNTEMLPMILNWEIGNESCSAAQKRRDYPCHNGTTECVDRNETSASSGYFCRCSSGYQGNPYLTDGCQDTDECASNPCKNGKCTNLLGNYSCSCNRGYKNQDVITCIKDTSATSLKISLGVSLSFSVLLVATFGTYREMKKRKFKTVRKKYFDKNGGALFRDKLASYTGPEGKGATIFTEEEVKKATKNYHESEKVGEGSYGIVYKGILNKQKAAIKKSKVNAPITAKEPFVNEMILLSQINHTNVVRLLGCCFESQTPILVYEFIARGTLYEHIHRKDKKGSSPLPLALRLKIATETAEALRYLHHSISPPIIHRDVKTTNILIDENFTAKVSDFGASRLVPEFENQISTLVQGTQGYLDPQYLQSNTLTEKSDVYSFGVVLAELLTSRRAVSLEKPEEERNLANVFVSKVKEDRLDEILDREIVEGHLMEVTKMVADLAKSCLRLRGEERPSMKEVAGQLQRLATMARHPSGGEANISPSPKDTGNLVGSSASSASHVDIKGDGDGGDGADSSIIQITPLGDGR
ncbi:hypothetical protein ACE6H2_013689 [Prunus campanulata]